MSRESPGAHQKSADPLVRSGSLMALRWVAEIVGGTSERGGYRIIYYVKTADAVVLIAMYVKTAQVDISIAEIKQLIKIYHSRD